jgi:3'-phosphoadenosine 5'-phosphosulfate sulfotransferase (PAPS reductase)/FAD synthetase
VSEPLRILSLGAGVQSSTLLLMACRGEFHLDHAIFADTQWEPQAVYDWLEFLKDEAQKASIPLHIVTAGSLREACLETSDSGGYSAALPYFVAPAGIAQRRCTNDFKILPKHRYIKSALLGLSKQQRWPTKLAVTQLMGISIDEAHRMFRSDKAWESFEYPLIDMRMNRMDCVIWMEKNGYPPAPRSACIGCPFRSNHEWRTLSADEFADAVSFETQLQKTQPQFFLHRTLKPLLEVDLSPSDQVDMFANECHGLCHN